MPSYIFFLGTTFFNKFLFRLFDRIIFEERIYNICARIYLILSKQVKEDFTTEFRKIISTRVAINTSHTENLSAEWYQIKIFRSEREIPS